MTPTPKQNRIAEIAARWADEVVPRLHPIKPDPLGSGLQKLVHALRNDHAIDRMMVAFYLAMEESLPPITRPWPRPHAVQDGSPEHVGHCIRVLIYNTQIVAAPFREQRKAIPEDFVGLADEVANAFSESFEWFGPKRQLLDGLLMQRQTEALQRVDEHLLTFSGPDRAALWTDEALESAPEWSLTRTLAQSALRFFGQ